MITITTDQALQRWDTLPMTLREALYFEPNSDFLWKTCEAENIPDEKIYDVARIAGYVLMGFLHPEDMADELEELLAINPKSCASVAGAINQRVFAPLRQDIDKVYEPPSKFGGGPKILSEIAAPKIISQAATAVPATGALLPLPANQIKTSPPPAPQMEPKPKLSDVGWSRTTPEEPVVKLSQTSAPQPSSVGPSAPPPIPVKQVQIPIKGPVGEFERMAIQGGQRIVPAAPAQSAPAAATPGPVIIHEDAVSKPQQTTPNFRIQMPTEKFGDSKVAQLVKPAVLELGKAAPPPAQNPPNISTRVVHYSEYKAPATVPSTPAPKIPPAPQGPRQITEITSTPKPPMPPKPPAPPASPSQNRIVYKDYTAPQPPKAPPPMPNAPSVPPPPPPMLPPK